MFMSPFVHFLKSITKLFLGYCLEGWVRKPHGLSCLLFVSTAITWLDAAEQCQQLGAHLAIFDSHESMAWFMALRLAMTGTLLS